MHSARCDKPSGSFASYALMYSLFTLSLSMGMRPCQGKRRVLAEPWRGTGLVDPTGTSGTLLGHSIDIRGGLDLANNLFLQAGFVQFYFGGFRAMPRAAPGPPAPTTGTSSRRFCSDAGVRSCDQKERAGDAGGSFLRNGSRTRALLRVCRGWPEGQAKNGLVF